MECSCGSETKEHRIVRKKKVVCEYQRCEQCGRQLVTKGEYPVSDKRAIGVYARNHDEYKQFLAKLPEEKRDQHIYLTNYVSGRELSGLIFLDGCNLEIAQRSRVAHHHGV